MTTTKITCLLATIALFGAACRTNDKQPPPDFLAQNLDTTVSPATDFFQYANGAYMKALVTYWRDHYDWRTHEARLNRLPHFVAPVDGIDLHFITHPESSEEVEAIAGPGSVRWAKPPTSPKFMEPRSRADARAALPRGPSSG